ncbi:MAG: serine/threonine-protein kinase [Phycisphaerae bacterium]|nr:serine/threonine-protein kinase [Phycisphaerae bacterium]
MPHPDDTELGRLVVEQRLATPDEIDRTLKLRLDESQAGKARPMSQLLVDQGVVTAAQMKRLLEQLETIRPTQQIPGHQILGKLGSGAMATVFKARQLSLDRIVAIKVLPKKWSSDREFVDRFYKEGKAAAQLSHNNIVQAYDVAEAGGYHYFIMEFVDGHTVFDDLAKGKPYSEAEALRIVTQMARALKHAHERGIIHRDVKPKNIMITADGIAKLADMGLARQASDIEAAKSEAGRAYGTPYYISPEQIRGEVDIDFRADIYSLGATFYHMVTGRVPYDGPTPSAVMHKHLKEEFVPPDHINRSLTTGVAEVIEMMMAKNRRDRYGSTAELLEDLDAVSRGEPPLIARSRAPGAMLDPLAKAEAGGRAADETHIIHVNPGPDLRPWLILLGVALAASIVANVLQLILR